MNKYFCELAGSCLGFCLLCIISLLSLPAYAQDTDVVSACLVELENLECQAENVAKRCNAELAELKEICQNNIADAQAAVENKIGECDSIASSEGSDSANYTACKMSLSNLKAEAASVKSKCKAKIATKNSSCRNASKSSKASCKREKTAKKTECKQLKAMCQNNKKAVARASKTYTKEIRIASNLERRLQRSINKMDSKLASYDNKIAKVHIKITTERDKLFWYKNSDNGVACLLGIFTGNPNYCATFLKELEKMEVKVAKYEAEMAKHQKDKETYKLQQMSYINRLERDLANQNLKVEKAQNALLSEISKNSSAGCPYVSSALS